MTLVFGVVVVGPYHSGSHTWRCEQGVWRLGVNQAWPVSRVSSQHPVESGSGRRCGMLSGAWRCCGCYGRQESPIEPSEGETKGMVLLVYPDDCCSYVWASEAVKSRRTWSLLAGLDQRARTRVGGLFILLLVLLSCIMYIDLFWIN